MQRRICLLIIASVIMLSSFVCAYAQDASYFLTISNDLSVTVSDNVNISFNLEDRNNSKEINSIYMIIKYDPAMLEFKSLNNNITASEKEKGTIKVIYYGDSIKLGNIIDAKFKSIATGSSSVYVESCVCDTSKNSISGDAKSVDVTDATCNIKIENRCTYGVEVYDGIEYGEAPQNGKDFIFSLKNTNIYKYSNLKVTVNNVDVTDKIVKLSNDSYMLPSEYVSGDIKIIVQREKISCSHAVEIDTGSKDYKNEQNPNTGAPSFLPLVFFVGSVLPFVIRKNNKSSNHKTKRET